MPGAVCGLHPVCAVRLASVAAALPGPDLRRYRCGDHVGWGDGHVGRRGWDMRRVVRFAGGSAVVLAALFVGSGTAVAAPAGPAVAGTVGTQQGSGCSDSAAGSGSGGSDSSTAAGPLDMLCRLIQQGGAAASGGGAAGGTGGAAATSGSSRSAGTSSASTSSAGTGSAATGGGTAATGASATAPAPGSPGAAAPPAGGGVLSSILAFLAGCLQAVGL
ncbi:hypothetical protein FB558_4997 [Pseudonocardia kunmingensis]|uniref:Uncharacterized protein n=2 Tax=Pseudonocardia kunmingensis TaxID=630975 RepID=A0A543DIT0_9PSEU|nr:hypothetical protein FB558_4997 [Pseudonocardia kunmingensis]